MVLFTRRGVRQHPLHIPRIRQLAAALRLFRSSKRCNTLPQAFLGIVHRRRYLALEKHMIPYHDTSFEVVLCVRLGLELSWALRDY